MYSYHVSDLKFQQFTQLKGVQGFFSFLLLASCDTPGSSVKENQQHKWRPREEMLLWVRWAIWYL